MNDKIRIGVVGPCTSGKTTLTEELLIMGYEAKQIAQEHSYVQDMWLRLTNPDILIFLDVSFPNTLIRKKLNWSKPEFEIQQARLVHAKENADIYINTDDLTQKQVLLNVLDALNK